MQIWIILRISRRRERHIIFGTGGYTDTMGENIDGRYIVKAIIVPFSKSKHLKDPLSVTKNQHFQQKSITFNNMSVKSIRIRKSEKINRNHHFQSVGIPISDKKSSLPVSRKPTWVTDNGWRRTDGGRQTTDDNSGQVQSELSA